MSSEKIPRAGLRGEELILQLLSGDEAHERGVLLQPGFHHFPAGLESPGGVDEEDLPEPLWVVQKESIHLSMHHMHTLGICLLDRI